MKPPEFDQKTDKPGRYRVKRLFRPVIGDLVDEMFAKYINEAECILPVARLIDGFYLFGTLKIFVKILRGKLVTKFSGVFLDFGEFMKQKYESEMAKI